MEGMVSQYQFLHKYKGKKVFLTGHTGFKGAWMLQLLNYIGADVKGYALNTLNENDLFNLIEGEKISKSVIADIRDRSLLIKEILEYKPDFVFHLAAQPLVKLSYEIPSETFEVNSIGTANLLDAIRLLDKPCSVVLITTDKVYHNFEWDFPYRENDRLGGYDPYSASKACAELVIDSYRNSFFNIKYYDKHKKGIAVARAGNVIGGGDWSENRLIPDIIKSLSNEKIINIRNPDSIRPWQHVLEPIIGYLILGLKLHEKPLDFSTEFNFGPNNFDSLTVLEIVKISIEYWGKGDFQILKDLEQKHEAGILKLDISKAKSNLNWQPKLTTEKSISLTLDWYFSYFNNPKKMKQKTIDQIIDFLDTI